MNQELDENFDTERLLALPSISVAEAAWMAGITPESYEKFREQANLAHLPAVPMTELVRSCFTQLGQKETQLAMFRLQLAAALKREQELSEALRSKLTLNMTASYTLSPEPEITNKTSSNSGKNTSNKKSKKRKKKK